MVSMSIIDTGSNVQNDNTLIGIICFLVIMLILFIITSTYFRERCYKLEAEVRKLKKKLNRKHL